MASTEKIRQELKQKIDDVGRKIDELSQTIELRGKLMSAEAKSRGQKELAALRQERDSLKARFEDFRSDSTAAWDEFKTGMLAAWKELSESCSRAMETYKGKDNRD